MLLDDFSVSMIYGSFVLAPIVGVVVGSQARDDARSIADWIFGICFALLLIDGLRFLRGGPGHPSGGLGFIVLFLALIVAAGVGCRVASSRPPTAVPGLDEEDEGKSGPWDDQLA